MSNSYSKERKSCVWKTWVREMEIVFRHLIVKNIPGFTIESLTYFSGIYMNSHFWYCPHTCWPMARSALHSPTESFSHYRCQVRVGPPLQCMIANKLPPRTIELDWPCSPWEPIKCQINHHEMQRLATVCRIQPSSQLDPQGLALQWDNGGNVQYNAHSMETWGTI